ncbi:ABC transporter permease [Barrientosiimonas endolithica]|uniref:ABC transporter permease n=1 Tax=Barrientosiimonas endolithica TaxID=1535208 RepID=A0ABN6YLU0_9MICO|nr:ABC transporter permease [Barrientosiimonas endolithica]BDZ56960.1 hypothetical protein GCM10025872_06170 [Barrientosiimonas endolithica]
MTTPPPATPQPAPPGPLPAGNAAPSGTSPLSGPVVRLALRSLLGRARVLLLLALPVLLIALTLVQQRFAAMDGTATQNFLSTFGIGVVVPVVTLICTTTLISTEFDDGSIIQLLVKPISRVALVLSKALVILGAVVVFGVLPLGISAMVLHPGDGLPLAIVAGSAVSGVAYVGIFTALAVALRRSVVGALAYWLIWESTIAGLIGPTKWLSARSWGTSVLQAASDVTAEAAQPVPTAYAILAALVVLAGGVLLAGRRIVSMTLSDD